MTLEQRVEQLEKEMAVLKRQLKEQSFLRSYYLPLCFVRSLRT